MKLDDLFEQKSLVALKLDDYIRKNRYTKMSFAQKTDISRPTLDKLLSGSIDNRIMFTRHLQRILKKLDLSVDDFMLSGPGQEKLNVNVVEEKSSKGGREQTEGKKQNRLLEELLELCEIYY